MSSNRYMGRCLPVILATSISAASALIGFYFGARSTRTTGVESAALAGTKDENTLTADDEEEEEQESEDIPDGDLSIIQAGAFEPCKLVLVVRTDLKMTSGKIAAQCGHATLACYKALIKRNPKLVKHWEYSGQAKIALKGTSEEQMLELEAIAKSLNLCARSIQDQGLTQVEEGTRTVLGIGPAPVSLVNEVTGKLRLL